MALQTTSTETTHLLSPQRVDQLVREHYDPPDYPSYPQAWIDELKALSGHLDRAVPARSQALEAAGLSPLDAEHEAVRRHHAWLDAQTARIDRLTAMIIERLQQRKAVLTDLYRSLAPVAAERRRSAGHRYLSDQQWLQHVHRAIDAHRGRRRGDFLDNVVVAAEALAEHARRDGIFLAGVGDVQDARGIAHSTWTRAYTWLVEQGLACTLSERRLLTQVERALAIGTEDRAKVFRWRSVIQLQHAPDLLKPAKWVGPPRSGVLKESPYMKVVSTDLRPVDSGASRPEGAASPPAPMRKVRLWRQFRPATQTLYKLAVGLAERLTGYLPTNHLLTLQLGAQMTPQRTELCHAFRTASPVRLMPHLDRFASAGADPAALLVAIEDAEHRSGRRVWHRTWEPTRRLIAALRNLNPDDVMGVDEGGRR